jgi:hypothetical protein
MAYLNAQERQALLDELKDLNFVKAKRRLFQRMQKDDPEGSRLAFFRNAQHSGQLETRFIFEGLGTRVTLIEKHSKKEHESGKYYVSDYELIDVVVEALPENRL